MNRNITVYFFEYRIIKLPFKAYFRFFTLIEPSDIESPCTCLRSDVFSENEKNFTRLSFFPPMLSLLRNPTEVCHQPTQSDKNLHPLQFEGGKLFCRDRRVHFTLCSRVHCRINCLVASCNSLIWLLTIKGVMSYIAEAKSETYY